MRQGQKTTVLVVLATVLAVTACEIALRVVNVANAWRRAHAGCHGQSEPYDTPGQCKATNSTFARMEYHTYLGYLPAPHRGEGYVTNAQHFRYAEDLPTTKPANEVRVFITGGSAAWGAGANQEQIYTTVLEERLARRFPQRRVRVVSAGVGAYVSTQERILVEHYLVDFAPDIIVMFSGWNDIYNGYIGNNILEDQDFMNYRSRLEGTPSPPARIQKALAPRYEDFAFKLHYLSARVLRTLSRDRASIEREIANINRPPAIVVETLLRSIHGVVDLSRRHGFVLVFYLQPTFYSTAKSLTPWEQAALAESEREYAGFATYNRTLYEALRRRLPEDAAREAYLFVDGDAAVARDPRTLFVDHVHLGDRGNRRIAEGMEEHLAPLIAALR